MASDELAAVLRPPLTKEIDMLSGLTLTASFAALSILIAVPATAQDAGGSVQIKGFVTAVLPHGAISEVEADNIGLPGGAQTRATDSVVPTIAAEFFVSPNFSIETICCVTPHDVRGAGALAGAELIEGIAWEVRQATLRTNNTGTACKGITCGGR